MNQIKQLFQNETFRFGKSVALVAVAVGLLCHSEMSGRQSEISSEQLLASVEIDDLIDLELIEQKKRDAKAAAADELAKIQEKETLKSKPVETTEFVLDERMVLEEVRYQIAHHFELDSDFRIYFDRPWKAIKMQDSDWEIVMTSFPSQGLRSRFYIGFELWINGKRHSTWREGVRCELWIDAYVALQRIDRGTVLRGGLVAVKPVDSLSLYQGPVEIGTKLTDFVAVNSMKAGEPLVWRDLRERPLIQKNALIDVVAEEGLLKITLKAKALEDGVKGQVIRIRNLQSYNDIQAEVIGVNQAKVYF